VIGHSAEEPKEQYKANALNDGRVYVPFLVPVSAGGVDERAALWPELSGICRDISHPRALVLYFRGVPDGEAILSIQECLRNAALSAPSHGEQVRVPEGWKWVPVEATTEMVSALKARISCTSRGGILNAGNALNDANAAAPSAGSHKDEV
jgi:hypothetical protein